MCGKTTQSGPVWSGLAVLAARQPSINTAQVEKANYFF
jgi:hypothetical protein